MAKSAVLEREDCEARLLFLKDLTKPQTLGVEVLSSKKEQKAFYYFLFPFLTACDTVFGPRGIRGDSQ